METYPLQFGTVSTGNFSPKHLSSMRWLPVPTELLIGQFLSCSRNKMANAPNKKGNLHNWIC
jgi:hypothetical protein